MRGLKHQNRAHRIGGWKSHPTWVRGLKLAPLKDAVTRHRSHPTWVRGLKPSLVTRNVRSIGSHPTWVRGLKQRICVPNPRFRRVAPYVGAWIETRCREESDGRGTSHPTWVRGLKHLMRLRDWGQYRSHPTWVRGLKHTSPLRQSWICRVAPYVGAWIETTAIAAYEAASNGRTLRGCVD